MRAHHARPRRGIAVPPRPVPRLSGPRVPLPPTPRQTSYRMGPVGPRPPPMMGPPHSRLTRPSAGSAEAPRFSGGTSTTPVAPLRDDPPMGPRKAGAEEGRERRSGIRGPQAGEGCKGAGKRTYRDAPVPLPPNPGIFGWDAEEPMRRTLAQLTHNRLGVGWGGGGRTNGGSRCCQ